jgi:anthranilate phosphoribosyltransferase
MEAGIALAREAVASGRAMQVLDDYIRASRIGEVAS